MRQKTFDCDDDEDDDVYLDLLWLFLLFDDFFLDFFADLGLLVAFDLVSANSFDLTLWFSSIFSVRSIKSSSSICFDSSTRLLESKFTFCCE